MRSPPATQCRLDVEARLVLPSSKQRAMLWGTTLKTAIYDEGEEWEELFGIGLCSLNMIKILGGSFGQLETVLRHSRPLLLWVDMASHARSWLSEPKILSLGISGQAGLHGAQSWRVLCSHAVCIGGSRLC